jgi:hypothetical protein
MTPRSIILCEWSRRYRWRDISFASATEKQISYSLGILSEIVYDFSEYHSAYEGFFMSDLGHLVVRTCEKTGDGKDVNDVFDAEGRFLGRIPLKSYGIAILKDKYYALEQDGEGYQYVKLYAVTWKVK